MDTMLPIEQLVRDLKMDRDTWQAVALQFKAAFEAQTARLQELQDICFATQAELENERVQQHRAYSTAALTESASSPCSDLLEHPFGTATIYSRAGIRVDDSRQALHGCTNSLFSGVRECADQKNYGSALTHVERLLRGPLNPKARAEALLLKSMVLKASGPEEIFNALAACCEAAELCNRLSELEGFLPQIEDQRNLLYHELQMLHQAPNNHGDLRLPQPSGFYNTCDDNDDDEPDLLRCAKRRSGFDENRTIEGLLAQLEEKAKDSKRRRISAHFKQRAAARARRISAPHRWAKARSE